MTTPSKERILNILERMTDEQDPGVKNNRGWFLLDEILYVVSANLGYRMNHKRLLEPLRDLYRENAIMHKKNGSQDVFKILKPTISESPANTLFVTIPEPPSQLTPKKSFRATMPDGVAHHRKAAFAAMRALNLHNAGISEDRLWDSFKKEFNIESRSKFNEEQWATCAARLNMFRRFPNLLVAEAKRIKDATH